MKALFIVLIASLFASDFQDLGEDELKIPKIVKKVAPVLIKKAVPMIPKVGPIVAPFLAEEDEEEDDRVQWGVTVTIRWGNEDMFAPEFDDIEDELKLKIGKLIKKILPVVVPKIPKVGPIIAPFLSEEDMEPEAIEYDEDELADAVLAELGEEYEIDAGFWKSVKKFVKKVAPVVIKKVVPMIPKVGPIVAPFLGEEDSDEMIMNMSNPFAQKREGRYRQKPIGGRKRTPERTVQRELDSVSVAPIMLPGCAPPPPCPNGQKTCFHVMVCLPNYKCPANHKLAYDPEHKRNMCVPQS